MVRRSLHLEAITRKSICMCTSQISPLDREPDCNMPVACCRQTCMLIFDYQHAVDTQLTDVAVLLSPIAPGQSCCENCCMQIRSDCASSESGGRTCLVSGPPLRQYSIWCFAEVHPWLVHAVTETSWIRPESMKATVAYQPESLSRERWRTCPDSLHPIRRIANKAMCSQTAHRPGDNFALLLVLLLSLFVG